MHCKTCGNRIPVERLRAMPETTQCTSCVRKHGDEPPVQGIMVWDHKTAPYIEVGTKLAATRPNPHPRMGKGASNGTLLTCTTTQLDSFEVVNAPRAKCHPERPAVAQGKCVECAAEWYRNQLLCRR